VTARSGPAVVAIGGGHGLAASLRAAKRYAGSITAVVSVADDGGSSGRLRQSLGIPAPGDLRRCLAALAPEDGLLGRALEHRFDAGELDGHALGNLLIAGLTEITGDFVAALDEVARLIDAAGRVLPATPEPVVLKAVVDDGELEGQKAIAHAGGIRRVSLVPADPPATTAAVEAIAAADQIVLGPGSLFTSVLAAVAVPGIRGAIAATRARRVYVANLRQQMPETAGFAIADHVAALRDHGVEVDAVLVHPDSLPIGDPGVTVVERAVALPDSTAHDPALLAEALAALL
jgi:uncharacterized cofD-like protein